jgi:hypothetical protein
MDVSRRCAWTDCGHLVRKAGIAARLHGWLLDPARHEAVRKSGSVLAGFGIDQAAQPALAAALRTIAANLEGFGGGNRFTTRVSNQPISPRRSRTMPRSCLQARDGGGRPSSRGACGLREHDRPRRAPARISAGRRAALILAGHGIQPAHQCASSRGWMPSERRPGGEVPMAAQAIRQRPARDGRPFPPVFRSWQLRLAG